MPPLDIPSLYSPPCLHFPCFPSFLVSVTITSCNGEGSQTSRLWSYVSRAPKLVRITAFPYYFLFILSPSVFSLPLGCELLQGRDHISYSSGIHGAWQNTRLSHK